MIGEIDCREGMLVAVERDKYDSVSTAMKATIALFLQVIVPLVRKRKFRAFVHPIVPVLNETRHLVTEFNSILKSAVDNIKGINY